MNLDIKPDIYKSSQVTDWSLVSVEDARRGAMNVIAYLKGHPPVDEDFIETLLRILEHLDNVEKQCSGYELENNQMINMLDGDDFDADALEGTKDLDSKVEDSECDDVGNLLDDTQVNPAQVKWMSKRSHDDPDAVTNISEVESRQLVSSNGLLYELRRLSTPADDHCDESNKPDSVQGVDNDWKSPIPNIRGKKQRKRQLKPKRKTTRRIRAKKSELSIPIEDEESEEQTESKCNENEPTSGDKHIAHEVDTVEPYTCSVCKKQLRRPAYLQKHFSKYHKDLLKHEYQCVLCDHVAETARKLQKHLLTHRPYRCDLCGKSFGYEMALDIHKRRHGEVKPHACSKCARRFNTTEELKEHSSSHRNADELYVCELCNKSFRYRGSIKVHMAGHAEERPYKCDKCPKAFKHKLTWIKHDMVHRDVRNYMCAICGKKFREAVSLRQHQVVHTEEKPFECKFCAKKFSWKMGLQEHMRRHAGDLPYQCAQCGRRFLQPSRLETHKRVHTGEKPYECPTCGRKFAAKLTMNRHMVVHTGDRPHVCSICGTGFSQIGSRRLHMKNVHGIVRSDAYFVEDIVSQNTGTQKSLDTTALS